MKRKEPIKNSEFDYEHGIVDVLPISASMYGQCLHSYHYHNCYEICIVRKGVLNVLINNLPREIEANSILMGGTNVPHGIVGCSDDFAGILIHLSFDASLWNVNSIFDSANDVQFIKDSQYGYLFLSQRLTVRLVALSKKIGKARGFLRLSYLFQLLNVLSEYPTRELLVANAGDSASLSKSPDETSVERTFRFLYAHYQEDLTLDEVAAYANQNASSLCRSFKNVCGSTIFQFMNRLRIEKACSLLKNTDLSISQIAYQVGFNSLAHFNNQFKKIAKTLPSAYRKY